MDTLVNILRRGDRDLMRQYVMAIMATSGKRSRYGRDLIAKRKITPMKGLLHYYLPAKPTPRDIDMLVKDINHYL